MSYTIVRTMTFVVIIGFSTAFQIQAADETSTDQAQIIEKIVQAYGGRTALEKVKLVKHTGTIKSHRLNKTGTLQRLFARPGKLRVDLSYPDGPQEQRITTPAGAWRNGQPATAPMHMAMTLQAARFRLPLILTEKTVTLLGEADDKLQLSVSLTPNTSLEVFVDRQSWRIVRSVGRMAFSGMNMAFIADYSDFRKVDGVLFPFREDLTAMGRPTGIAILERIEINPETKPDDFVSQQPLSEPSQKKGRSI